MKVREIMTASVESIQSTDTIGDAARIMADHDVGVLPVLSNRALVGIVTDRDIAVRGVAAGIAPEAPIRRVMTEDVTICSADDEVDDVLEIMSSEQIRRMPVCRGGEEVVGIVTLADAVRRDSEKREVAGTLAKICEPSGLHCQSPLFA